jgi:hypothetical protein
MASDSIMKRYVERGYMSQAKYADHDVLDVRDVRNCSGIFTY